jgi:FxsC-like protein
VALYAPGYFKKSWPQRELESFRQRLARSNDPHAARHLLPVLWVPFLAWDTLVDVREALMVGRDAPDYADNGIRGLCMLSHLSDQYRKVVQRVAKHIVDTAEGFPLKRSRAPSFEELPAISIAEPDFIVAVLAPDRHSLPPERSAATYAANAAGWRPFGPRQALSVAEHAAITAERLGLATQVGTLGEVSKRLDRCPAVVLIDPWSIETAKGARALRTAMAKLPTWAIPVIITDTEDPEYDRHGRTLAERTAAELTSASVPFAPRISQVREFADVMPGLINEARRQYLTKGPVPESWD